MTRQVKPVRPAAKMFGVEFSEDQWHAANIRPPLWNLNPPQREEYDHDAAYAVALPLKILVAFLQAFIFCMLSMLYIAGATEDTEHH